MYKEFNIFDDLIAVINSSEEPVNNIYRSIIYDVNELGFSYNNPMMTGMIHMLFKSNLMIAHNLLQNSVDEAKGAARVDIIADKYADPILKAKMKRHVADELKHSKMFANAIECTGYSKEIDTSKEAEHSIEDVFNFDDDLKTFLCRVHSIEIRSWTMLRHYINELKQKNDPKLNPLIPMLELIKEDEIQHVLYTANQINYWLNQKEDIGSILKNCFMHTNRETWHDLGHMSNYLADNYQNIG